MTETVAVRSTIQTKPPPQEVEMWLHQRGREPRLVIVKINRQED